MRYQGRQLKLERNNMTRSMQVLQLLLYSGAEGVPKQTLMDAIFGDDETVTNPANNLKVTISNLRRILKREGLPDTTTVVFKGGNYHFVSDLEILVDAFLFEQQVQRAEQSTGADRLHQLEQACGLYGGDFLPHMAGDDWAMAAAVHYKKEYMDCAAQLAGALEQAQNWQQLLRLASQASVLCPQEEWDVLRIRSLLAMERYQEAKEVYEETVNRMMDEFGVKPSPRLTDCLRQLEEAVPGRKASLEQLQEVLREDERQQGAYYCPFPSFIDTYRTVCRMLERSGQSAYLMMCWLTDKNDQRVEDKKALGRVMPLVGEAIQAALRRGDVYTKAENDRYLVLLLGINKENCNIVTQRIGNSYKELRRGGRVPAMNLHFKTAPVYDHLDTASGAGRFEL